jgi:hypothetical protein
VSRASQNDQAAVLALREYLKQHPEIWQEAGNLARMAETAQINLVCGKDVLARESVALRLKALKQELAGAAASPLEKILIEWVAICWLQAYAADILLAQASQADQDPPAFLRERAERAEKSFLNATKELCVIRKLLREAQAKPLRQSRSPKSKTAPPAAEETRGNGCAASP